MLCYYHQHKEVGASPDCANVVVDPSSSLSLEKSLTFALRGHYYNVANREVLAFHLITFSEF